MHLWPARCDYCEETIHTNQRMVDGEPRSRIPSLLFAYSLGKAQRVIAGLDAQMGPIYVHGAVDEFMRIYANLGIDLPVVEKVDRHLQRDYDGAMIVAPPAVEDSKVGKTRGAKRGFASGWMAIRGATEGNLFAGSSYPIMRTGRA